MKNYDLIVLGGGPGGYPTALRMAQKGLKVAIVDRSLEFGGTCLNWGCIPTKALLASAHAYHNLKNISNFGLDCSEYSFNWQAILARKNKIVQQLRNGIMGLLEKAGVHVYPGFGKLFPGKKIVVDNDVELVADKICLAVGSVPSMPGSFPDNRKIFWTSNQALNAGEIPESLLVVGGGVIGMELGQVFNEFGSKVTVVEMMPQIMTGLDTATAKRILPVFKKTGMEIMVGKAVEALKEVNGQAMAIINGKERYFSKVLVAVGRRLNRSFMEGTELKLELENGFIKVDDNYQTSQNGVYAIGDAIKGPMLAHKASYDAMIFSRQLSGEQVSADYSLVPSCVYTYPEVAWVGESEQSLKEKNISYKTGRSLFSANGKALADGDSEGQIKSLFGDDNKLLGAIIWGPQASNLINQAGMMGAFGIDGQKLSDMIFPHPTLAEAWLESVENAFGTGAHG